VDRLKVAGKCEYGVSHFAQRDGAVEQKARADILSVDGRSSAVCGRQTIVDICRVKPVQIGVGRQVSTIRCPDTQRDRRTKIFFSNRKNSIQVYG
jgi:hypothetical protein